MENKEEIAEPLLTKVVPDHRNSYEIYYSYHDSGASSSNSPPHSHLSSSPTSSQSSASSSDLSIPNHPPSFIFHDANPPLKIECILPLQPILPFRITLGTPPPQPIIGDHRCPDFSQPILGDRSSSDCSQRILGDRSSPDSSEPSPQWIDSRVNTITFIFMFALTASGLFKEMYFSPDLSTSERYYPLWAFLGIVLVFMLIAKRLKYL